MVTKSLEEAGRLLQEEIDKQLRVAGCQQEKETNNNDEVDSPRTAAPAPAKMGMSMDIHAMDGMDMDDPMIAEFFAKQMASEKEQTVEQQLPLKAWAANVIQAKKSDTVAVGGEHPLNETSKQQELLVDRLYTKFVTLQNS